MNEQFNSLSTVDDIRRSYSTKCWWNWYLYARHGKQNNL